MTKEEAYKFLMNISYALGNMSIEYLTEKDGEKMREAIEILQQEPDWIPVSEDLPTLEKSKIERSDDVLVTDGIDTYIGYLVERAGKTSWHIYEDVDVDIIAWMPLPAEPYKAESENEE